MTALAVEHALKKKGYFAVRWFGRNCPSQQTQTIRIGEQNSFEVTDDNGNHFEANDFDVIWNRRPQLPDFSNDIHPDDLQPAKKNWIDFYLSTWFSFKPDAFWVNSVESYQKANRKSVQLKVARDVGLNIPETIISNDPNHVRDFVSMQSEGAIFKSLTSHTWEHDDKKIITRTVPIDSSQLTNLNAIKKSPGIFQAAIKKAYELRITYFGNHYIAAKINSQKDNRGKWDWRSIPISQLEVLEVELPNSVNEKCKALMKQLGIVFGCFDFIVTPDGEYFFIEVNEMGQFLWIENINSDIKILDVFCEFLISKDPNYSGKKMYPAVDANEILSSSEFNDMHKKELISNVRDIST